MTCSIRHSRIPSIPILGYFFYFIELLLIYGNFSQTFYMSAKEKTFIAFITRSLEKRCSSIYVQTEKIGRNLLLFEKPVILDLPENLALDLQNEDTYNQVLWTFVASNQLSSSTKKLLKKHHLSGIIHSFDESKMT